MFLFIVKVLFCTAEGALLEYSFCATWTTIYLSANMSLYLYYYKVEPLVRWVPLQRWSITIQ